MSTTAFFSDSRSNMLHLTNEMHYVKRKIRTSFTTNFEHRISRTAHLHTWLLALEEAKRALEERIAFELTIRERLLNTA